jgi:hypothetical protein
MRSYLANKSAFFFFNNYKLLQFNILADVPQELPLSPILFLLYIATFYKNLQTAYPRLSIVEFADNTNLIITNRIFKKTAISKKMLEEDALNDHASTAWNSPQQKMNYYILTARAMLARY